MAGDGVTDDHDAISNATYDGNRCGYPCDSQTTTPAIVYFPPGTYAISKPVIMLYYTQFIGDANDLPVVLGLPHFRGIGLLDADPYLGGGASWWANQVCQPDTCHQCSADDWCVEQHVAPSSQFRSGHSSSSPWRDTLLALASRSRRFAAEHRFRDD
jgi:hypothetical protein